MTLVSSIIIDAFREANIIPIGKEPTENQAVEALRLYNALLDAMYGGDAGERLEDWPLGNFARDPDRDRLIVDRHMKRPPINSRLIAVNDEPMTVWLVPHPQDGSRMGIADPYSRLATAPVTLNGDSRPIEDGSEIVLNEPGLFREWMYRADLSRWVRVTGVVSTDENPFPSRFDAMFAIMLAMRLNPRYGRTIDPQSTVVLQRGRREFVARYLQSRPLEILDDISWPFMSIQSYNTDRAFSSQRAFNRGNYGE